MNEINIENLTIKQARDLATILAGMGLGPTIQPLEGAAVVAGIEEEKNPASVLIGSHVIVRSHMSGVWFGRLEAVSSAGAVLLSGARRAWNWTGAGSCSGLARRGPTGGKIAGPVARQAIDVFVEICECSPEAVEQWGKLPEWTGRE